LVDRCIRGTSYTGITYPNAFCRLRDYCPIGGKQRPMPEPPPEINARQVGRADLPRFTPIISVIDRRSWFWDDFPLPALFVRLGEILTNKGLLNEVSKVGLHDYLGYDGKIALSTIMPDEIIDKLKPVDYIKLVGDLRPDVAMVSDNHTYVDDPFYLSWSQTIRLVRYAAELRDLGVPVLGLVKGAISKQTQWCIEKQLQLGYTSFALPVRELARVDLLDGYLTTTTYTLRKAGANPELVVYGLSHRIRRLKGAKYATLSWYIHAKRRFIFLGEKTRSVLYPDIEYVPAIALPARELGRMTCYMMYESSHFTTCYSRRPDSRGGLADGGREARGPGRPALRSGKSTMDQGEGGLRGGRRTPCLVWAP